MKGNSKKLAVFVMITAITMFATTATAWDNDQGNALPCSHSLLHGKYIYGIQGFTWLPFAPPPTSPPLTSDYTPVTLAGTVSFDGHGNLTSFDWANLGFVVLPRTGAGTYAVDTTSHGYGFCAFSGTWRFTNISDQFPGFYDLEFYMVPGLGGSVVNVISKNDMNMAVGPLYKQ